MDMTFKRATDILGLPASELAKEFGIQAQTIRQMRLERSAPNYRSPPQRWQQGLVVLARKREKELRDLIEQLERRGKQKKADRLTTD